MPKIRILTAHYMEGKGGVAEGDVFDVDEPTARLKVIKGYAELVDEQLPPETGEVKFDQSAVEPKPKGKK